MSTSYFAHHAFGVEMSEADVDLLDARIALAYTAARAAYRTWELETADDEDPDGAPAVPDEDDPWARVEFGLDRLSDAERAGFLDRAGAPPDAHLIWTGPPGDRPGRCDTPANAWIVGYGVFDFPRQMSSEFRVRGQWFSWVTC